MTEINEFDDYLKDALSNLRADISPGDWDYFAKKLNVADESLSETSDFDGLIRDRMESLEINADANYWEVMESKIDQEINLSNISDEALDQIATDNLTNLYIPYNPTHWTLLSHRLEEEFNVRRKIVSYKLVEFSLMVLLLLTIIQFMPIYPSIHVKNTVTVETQTEFLEVSLNENANENAILSAKKTSPSVNKNSSVDINSNKNINLTVIADNTPHANNLPAKIIFSNEENTSSLPLGTTTISEIVSNLAEKKVTTEKEDVKISLTLEGTPSATDQATFALTKLPVTFSELDHHSDWSAIGLLKKFPKKVIVRLGAMSSVDLNYIKTPSTSRYKNNGYQQYQLGYGGGIVLDFNYEQFTLSTGLIYRRINYYPQEEISRAYYREEEEISIPGSSIDGGYQSRVFDAVNLNLLTIPMNLQFQINDANKKWKLHAITGASLNLLALNHYNITVNNLEPTTFNLAGPAPQGPPPVTTTPDELFREADIAGEGLFEGGTFERNHFFTANLGIGVERFISPRWSLFIQPVYQHEIFGKNLGLNRDRIHTLSVQIGAKSTFK